MVHGGREVARSDLRVVVTVDEKDATVLFAGSLTRRARLDVAQGDRGRGSKLQGAEPALRWARHGSNGEGAWGRRGRWRRSGAGSGMVVRLLERREQRVAERRGWSGSVVSVRVPWPLSWLKPGRLQIRPGNKHAARLAASPLVEHKPWFCSRTTTDA